ncbi:MAG: hypothetical protein WDO74_13680 [Pseudomonadota bacterium]
MTLTSGLALDVISGATLDGAYFELPVERARLAQRLTGLGPLRLAERGDPADDTHPIVCELWRVTNGRLFPAGIDQYDLLDRWQGLFASAGALGKACSNWLHGLRRLSWGPYNELLIGVPDVQIEDDPERYTLVLGMATDDRLALAIDRVVGYGYSKRFGQFSFAPSGAVHVQAEGEPLISGMLPVPACQPLRAAADFSWLDQRWQQSLLGRRANGTWCSSRLERRLASATELRLADGSLVLHEALGVPLAATHALSSEPSAAARAALFRGVTTRISLPHARPCHRRSR